MKIATKDIPIYNGLGKCLIGELTCGDEVQEIDENSSGILVAYIVGLIKQKDMAALVSSEEWEKSAEQRQKLVDFISNQQGTLNVRGAQDCSELVTRFLLNEGLIPGNFSANELYHHECRGISRDELIAGDIVFKKYLIKNQMHHVGVYMGDGTVVHTKGRAGGVVREPLSAAGWNRFGSLKCLRGAQIAVAYRRSLKNTGRPYACGDDIRAVQRSLERKGYFAGAVNGVFEQKTEDAVKAFQQAAGLSVDGIVGTKTWTALFV